MKKVIFLPLVLVLVFSSCKKRGCTDPIANNYNSSAEKDNGNCTYLDIDGNSYNSKAIGNQVWMTENLEVKKYRNGDIIPQVQDNSQWDALTTGAWCYYDNDPSKGILYNWFAVNDPRGLAPIGWHVASDSEWTILTDSLGDYAGTQMKNTSGWLDAGNGTNSSGFSGLPEGNRYGNGNFINIGAGGYWWSSTESGTDYAYFRCLLSYNSILDRSVYFKDWGLSVRCIKD
jgi:uncharacterized protein (TIGR02145 family)